MLGALALAALAFGAMLALDAADDRAARGRVALAADARERWRRALASGARWKAARRAAAIERRRAIERRGEP